MFVIFSTTIANTRNHSQRTREILRDLVEMFYLHSRRLETQATKADLNSKPS